MMGLFSNIDIMLNQTMQDALIDIALPKTITDVLIHKRGDLWPIYQLLISYEQGDWDTAEEGSKIEKDMMACVNVDASHFSFVKVLQSTLI